MWWLVIVVSVQVTAVGTVCDDVDGAAAVKQMTSVPRLICISS